MSRTILHNGKFTTLDPARPRARHVKAPAEPFWGAVGCSCFAF